MAAVGPAYYKDLRGLVLDRYIADDVDMTTVKSADTMIQLAEIIDNWRVDATRFAVECLGVVPTEQQELILDNASKLNARVAVKSGHGIGKSSSLAWLILWGLVCYDDMLIACTAPTNHQLNDILMAEVKKWAKDMLEPWRSAIRFRQFEIRMETLQGRCVMRTGQRGNPEALQGFHAASMLYIIDEASGVDEAVFETARGALSTPGARIVMTANPTRASGFFYNAFNVNRDSWRRLTLSSADSPNVTPEYVADMAREYGVESDVYRVRVLGEFPSRGDMQFISTDLADKAAARYLDEIAYSYAPLVIGCDVANYGGDRSVIYLRQGLYSKLLLSMHGQDDTWLMRYTDQIVKYADEYNADAIMVDGAGVGAGVVSRLHQLGRKPINVQFGGASSAPEYLNKRAECWGLMREWLQDGGWIERNDDLIADLTAPEYQLNIKGLIQLERKEDIKKRGVHSPDLADALALTFAVPVNPHKARGSYSPVSAPGKPGAAYNPFKQLNKGR